VIWFYPQENAEDLMELQELIAKHSLQNLIITKLKTQAVENIDKIVKYTGRINGCTWRFRVGNSLLNEVPLMLKRKVNTKSCPASNSCYCITQNDGNHDRKFKNQRAVKHGLIVLNVMDGADAVMFL
jgi:hypothetical protein